MPRCQVGDRVMVHPSTSNLSDLDSAEGTVVVVTDGLTASGEPFQSLHVKLDGDGSTLGIASTNVTLLERQS